MDIAIHAVKRVASVRLGDRLGLREGVEYDIQGVPRNVEGAKDLWRRDPHFQPLGERKLRNFEQYMAQAGVLDGLGRNTPA